MREVLHLPLVSFLLLVGVGAEEGLGGHCFLFQEDEGEP